MANPTYSDLETLEQDCMARNASIAAAAHTECCTTQWGGSPSECDCEALGLPAALLSQAGE